MTPAAAMKPGMAVSVDIAGNAGAGAGSGAGAGAGVRGSGARSEAQSGTAGAEAARAAKGGATGGAGGTGNAPVPGNAGGPARPVGTGEPPYLTWAAIGSLGLHAGVGAAMFLGFATGPSAPPPAAMVVEIASLPSAPPAPPTDMPPQPEQEEAKPKPVVNRLDIPPIPKLAFNVKPAVAVPLKEPEDLNRKQAEKPAEETTRAAAPSAPREDRPAAPNMGAPSDQPSNAAMNWEAKVMATLERRKRYPSDAAGAQDIIRVRMTIDRSGRIVGSQILRSKGVGPLNAEVTALMRRASPLPKPPKDIAGELIVRTVDVDFTMKK
ncbi:protein TonB [Sphingopyxis sp. YR583]|uniref:energy transducer TonB family protein n=1 Tax=Sphingopyxis sp. YR583 TaxID=1881047 RepID=UPI0008A77900|nr:TonB family protein [Sphingopyxis sp. YR583]SEH12960.1 protein TonB [Sphingopyxis sp. YR583]